MAICSSSLLQIKVLFVALSGNTVALNWYLLPTISSITSLSSVIDVTATSSFSIITLQTALKFPLAVLTIIWVLPSLTALTNPSWSTVATLSSLLSQTTPFSVAFSGRTVAVSRKEFPTGPDSHFDRTLAKFNPGDFYHLILFLLTRTGGNHAST